MRLLSCFHSSRRRSTVTSPTPYPVLEWKDKVYKAMFFLRVGCISIDCLKPAALIQRDDPLEDHPYTAHIVQILRKESVFYYLPRKQTEAQRSANGDAVLDGCPDRNVSRNHKTPAGKDDDHDRNDSSSTVW